MKTHPADNTIFFPDMSGTGPPQDVDSARAAESNFGRMMAINGTFQYVPGS
jgi:hypothetical protein